MSNEARFSVGEEVVVVGFIYVNGFIAEDKATKEVYFNQYPRAKYGQITDTEDRVFISSEKSPKIRERPYTLSELLDSAITLMKSDIPL